MTTTIRITLPIAPGATTCEGCDRYNDHDHCGDWCEPHKKRLPISGARLPECIAGERVKICDFWELRSPAGAVLYKSFFRTSSCLRRPNRAAGERVFHVTIYRRRNGRQRTA